MKKKILIFLSPAILLLSSCVFLQSEDDIVEIEQVVIDVSSNTQNLYVEPPSMQLEPVQGGGLSVVSRRPSTLNPIINIDESVNEVLGFIFESLFVLLDGQMEPMLAESLNQTSATSAILTLREATWSDGTSITTDDVAFTINAIRNNNSLFSVSNITSHNIIDERTIVLNFSSNIEFIDYELTFPIIPRHHYQNRMNAASLAPVGSGPFKFKEQTGRNIILTRNPNFRYNVYLSYVNIVISPDRETDFNAFLGNVVTALTTNMSELAKYGISITPFNTSPIFTYELDFFAFNTSNPHFSDVRVREAITLAFPFNALYNVYIGQITRSSSFVHPNSRHYVEGFLRENDLNRAFEELIEVGFSVENDLLGNSLDIFIPFMLRILVNTENTERLSLANSLRNNLEQLGIQVNFMALPFNEFYEEVQAGNFDILFAGTQLSNNFSAGFMNVFSYTAPSLSIYELQRHINTQIPMVAIGFRNHILLTNREELRGNIRPSPTNPFQNVHEWFVGIRDI